MLEAVSVRPGRQMGAPLLREMFLKADDVGAGVRIACGDGAADARVAAFKSDFADVETDYAAKFSPEELVFPEWRHTIELQSGAETQTGFREGHAGEPFADGLKRRRGDYRWAVGDEIVGNTGGIVANHDGVAQIFGEPIGGGDGVIGERECGDRNVATVTWNGEGDAGEVRRIRGANQVQRCDAGSGNQSAVEGIDGPGAVELEAAGGAYWGGGNFYGVERFDGMDLDAGQARKYWLRFHAITLTEWGEPSRVMRDGVGSPNNFTILFIFAILYVDNN